MFANLSFCIVDMAIDSILPLLHVEYSCCAFLMVSFQYHCGLGRCSARPILKAWLPNCGTVGRWWNLLAAGPNGRKFGYWRHALEGDTGTQPFGSTSFASPLSWREHSSQTHASSMMYCAVTGPELQVQVTMVWA
jgi:hypothetical protein